MPYLVSVILPMFKANDTSAETSYSYVLLTYHSTNKLIGYAVIIYIVLMDNLS